jgi:ubiquitin C-terminal hydrolase
MVNPSSSQNSQKIINEEIISLIKSSDEFAQKVTPVLKDHQKEENAGFIRLIFFALRDFFALFSDSIKPSSKVRMIRIVEEFSENLSQERINKVASAILGNSKFECNTTVSPEVNQSNSIKSTKETLKKISDLLIDKNTEGSPAIISGRVKKSKGVFLKEKFSKIFSILKTIFDPSYQIDERGFANLGNTCFMNSSIRLFLSKNNIENLIFDLNTDEKKPKTLNKRPEESEQYFEARQKLLNNVVSLYLEVKKESASHEEISNWLHEIASSIIFTDKLGYFHEQEDAQEFLGFLSDALDLNGDSSMSITCRREKNNNGVFNAVGTDDPFSIFILSNSNGNNPSSLMTKCLAEETVEGSVYRYSLRHTNLDDLKSLIVTMPRFDDASEKSSQPIESVFESFNIEVFDEAKGKKVFVKLNPKSAVCHIGSSLKHGHYVLLVKEGDKFFEKNDLLIKELTKEEAETYASTKVFLVDYDVEVLNGAANTKTTSEIKSSSAVIIDEREDN